MRIPRTPRVNLAGLLLAAGLVVAVTSAATAATASPAARPGASRHLITFRVTNPRITLTGPVKPGTLEGSTFDNYQAGRMVGVDYVSCTIVDTHGDNQCNVTVFLPGGAMELVYPGNVAATHLTAPIVGGSGRYVGARGYISLSPTHGGQRAVVHLL